MHIILPVPVDLTDVQELRIYHSPTAVPISPGIAAKIGLDNIRAMPEPETTTLMMLGSLHVRRRCRV